MTLQQKFDQELTNLGNGAAVSVTIEDSPRQLLCDIAERNSLAVSFHELWLSTTELATAAPDRLSKIGQALSARLTYLMEPVSPIELDAEACIVQLRSNPPQRDDDGRSYYELIVARGGHIALKRYRKDNGNARQPVVATVTREVLLRLTADFEAALD